MGPVSAWSYRPLAAPGAVVTRPGAPFCSVVQVIIGIVYQTDVKYRVFCRQGESGKGYENNSRKRENNHFKQWFFSHKSSLLVLTKGK
jgi:hypothetical protein